MSGRFPHIQDPMTFLESLEALFRRAEAHDDPAVRDLVLDLADAVMHLHHEALFRVVVLLRNLPGGGDVLQVLEGDQVVGPLLREHGLLDAPTEPLEARIEAALEDVRPYMHGHGGNVELIEVRDGVARLQLQGACHGCASSTLTLKMGVERALREAVPELTAIEVEGLPAPAPAARRSPPPEGFIPVNSIAPAKVWKEVGAAQAFTYGTRHVAVNGAAVLLCSAFGRIYAVRDRCPRGGGSLQDARLEAFLLVCPCHDERYDLRSGHSLLEPSLTLDHVPIVIEQGHVRVAVG
jgi:Fe-S cluster biogenesis protein NfuA/nitrite reductase/ring-hydroxylating ferredoxin subunit